MVSAAGRRAMSKHAEDVVTGIHVEQPPKLPLERQGGTLTYRTAGRIADYEFLLQKLAVLVKAWFPEVCESGT